MSVVIDQTARAMCAVESRSKAATLEEVADGIQRWTRHRYEAERLVNELRDYGLEVRRISTAPPRDDERVALAAWFQEPGWRDYDAGALIASPVWRNRHRGPITDETVERVARAILMVTQGDVDPAYAWSVQYADVQEELLAQARAALEAAEATR